MRVKICGIAREEDAVLAQRLGAWAIGFVFVRGARHHVTARRAGDIMRALPAPLLGVGVFVNQTDEALEIARQVPLDALQLHGDETPEECARAKRAFPGLVIKGLRPADETGLQDIARYRDVADYILLDANVPGQYGGTGKVADWVLAAKAAQYGMPVILAGGLKADNIAEAARRVNPFALDLSSGVEASPGVKDAAKMESLFKAVKNEK